MTSSPQRILVVANETATSQELLRTTAAFAVDPHARVHVVAPAEVELHECLGHLRELGLDADGEVGDEDSVQAIADALLSFPATELILATSSYDLVDHALAVFGLPTMHVAVDVHAAAGLLVAA